MNVFLQSISKTRLRTVDTDSHPVNLLFVPIAALILGGQRQVYATILTLLFVTIIVNMAAYWQVVRDVMVVHDESWLTTIREEAVNHVSTSVLRSLTSRMDIFLADVILVCVQNKAMQLTILF